MTAACCVLIAAEPAGATPRGLTPEASELIDPGAPSSKPSEPREVVEARSEYSATFEMPDGSRQARLGAEPVHYQDSQKHWKRIDNSLTEVERGGWTNRANAVGVRLPENLGDAISIQGGGLELSMRYVTPEAATSTPPSEPETTTTSTTVPPGVPSSTTAPAAEPEPPASDTIAQHPTGRADESHVTYRLDPATELVYSAQARGVKELVQMASPEATRSVAFDLTGPSLDVRPDGNGGATIFKAGEAVGWIPAPFAFDANGDEGPASLEVTSTEGGFRVNLRADDGYLDVPGRSYPVTLDPTVLIGGPTGSTDCYISQASPTTRDCTSDFFRVGLDTSTARRNALLKFPDVSTVVPPDANIVGAKLQATNHSVTGTTPITIQASRVTNQWTTNLNWTKRNSVDNWSAAGGDFNGDYDTEAGSSVTIGSASVGVVNFALNQMVAGWVSHKFDNHGLALRVTSASTGNSANFRSSEYATSADRPVLFVDYRNRGGLSGSFEQFRLTDRQGLAVNRANTVATIASTELNIRGTGMDLNIGRFYNTHGNNGPWTWTVGADNYLYETSSGSVQYFAGTGEAYLFVKTKSGVYLRPYGLNAQLDDTGSGNFTLIDNKSKVKSYFEPKGNYTVPVRTEDRAATPNQIDYSYTVVSSYPQLTTITDTQNRTVSVAWSGGHITSFTETAPSPDRVVSYTWSGSNLTVARDSDNKDTTYQYDAQNRVEQITTPDSRITKIGYVLSTDDAVYEIDRVHNNGTGAAYTTTFNRVPTSMSPSDAGYTDITDANGNLAVAGFNSKDAVTKYTDALGHELEAAQYDDNGDATQLTDGVSSIFTATYDSNRNLTQTQSPSSGTNTGAQVVMTYGAGGGTDQFLMSSQSDLGSCSSFVYDGQGQLEDVYGGNTPNGFGTCQGDTSGDRTHIERSSDGTVDYVDPPIGSAGRIDYTYTGGNLTKTDSPAPIPDETYGVDSSSRRTQVVDSKGQDSRFVYDNIDRVVQVTFNGDNTCTSWTTCIQYDYDDDGNLIQRIDNTGTTSFTYDKLGRPTSKTLPGGVNACSSGGSAITYSYNPVSNLTSYCDAQGTVTYTFDDGDRMTGLAEPTGSCTTTPKTKCTAFDYDNSNRRTETTYPTSTPVVMTYEYLPDGQMKKAEAKRGVTILTSYNYTYNKSTNDTGLLRSMTDNVASTSRYYNYDTQNRLCWDAPASSGNACSSRPSAANQYTYDANGNRRTRTTSGGTVTTYAYNAADQLCWRYTGSSAALCASPPGGAVTYGYDNNGNQTSTTAGFAASYNSKDQATASTPEGGSSTASEYADVRQNQRTKIGTTNVYNGLQGVLQTKDSSNNTVTWTYDNDGSLVSQHRSVDSNARYYYLTDGRGNVVGLVNSSGTLANTYSYNAWGAVTASEAVPNPWRYRSGYYDSSTSTKFGARFYNQDIGRFTQRDPSGQEANPYLYANGDPVNRSDPSGLVDCAIPWDDGDNGCAGGSITGAQAAAVAGFGLAVIGYGFAVGACVVATVGLCAAGIGVAALSLLLAEYGLFSAW